MSPSCPCGLQDGKGDVPGVWKKDNKAGKAAGRRHLKEALKGHNSWKPFDSGKVLRFTDQLDVSGMTAPQASHYWELTLLQLAFPIALHGAWNSLQNVCCILLYTMPACQKPYFMPEGLGNNIGHSYTITYNCSICPDFTTRGTSNGVLQ